MISYRKLLSIFEQRNINTYAIKKFNIIGQASFAKIHSGGNIDTVTLNKLCKFLDCQPGDLLEYIPDKADE